MNDDDNIRDFLVESYENLDQLDRDLVALEIEPDNAARLANIFRTIHTIKGTCGFFGFAKLEAVSHVGENLLCQLRDGALSLTPDVVNGLLGLVDAVREILAHIEASREEGDGDYQGLIALLTRLQEPGAPAGFSAEVGSPSSVLPYLPAAAGPSANPPGRPPADRDPHRPPVPGRDPGAAPSSLARRSSGSLSVPVPGPCPPPGRPPASLTDEPRTVATVPQDHRPGGGVSDGSIRVDVHLLDRLMNLVGELVLARNQMLQYTAGQKDAGFLNAGQRLNLITSELQEGVMKTRMQPVGSVWNKFPRVVRDLAFQCGKQVRLEMEGQETELDKTILEAIKDPLTHLIRNTVDHGIERPDVRRERGKPAEGRLLLRAYHEGGQVNIEIADDGGGVNVERVRQKAVERGLVTPEQAARLNEAEAAQLIFLPGFSTAEKVTNVSGRGVGMDVVKTNIEKIGGSVDLTSRAGCGAAVKIKIPLTLAIVPALIVGTCGERFAIPQASLLELIRLDGAEPKGIESLHGAAVYRLRGRLLPLVFLHRELGLRAPRLDPAGALKTDPRPAGGPGAKSRPGADADSVTIVVLEADKRQFGLVVDRICDTEEIVVKPLNKQLRSIPVFAGATIMGDGAVALILDVMGIAQRSGVISGHMDRALLAADGARPGADEHQSFLLVRSGRARRLAVPLDVVARLEEIPPGRIEFTDRTEVVQYRDTIMPLVRLTTFFGDEPSGPPEALHVVVVCVGGLSVGILVDQILDIVDLSVGVWQKTRRPGLLGTAVLQDRVTDILDVPAVIRDVRAAFDPEPDSLTRLLCRSRVSLLPAATAGDRGNPGAAGGGGPRTLEVAVNNDY